MTHAPDESRSYAYFAPVLGLLAVCMFINYIDRANLSIAAPLIKVELGISATQLGFLLSGFFWTYTAMQFASGWLVDRFNVNWLIAAGFFLWSAATACTGLVTGFVLLFAMRLILGVGESVALPSCSKILARHLPESRRGFANGVIASAFRGGNAVGAFGGGLLMAKYGWRAIFIGVGVVSILWLPAWARWRPRDRHAQHIVHSAGPGFVDILRQRSFWGSSTGHFSANYLLYFMGSWLPFYLVRERHFSMQSMATTAGAYWLVDACTAIAAGWISDYSIRRGAAPTLVRKSTMGLGSAVAAVCIVGCAVAGPHSFIFWLLAAGTGCGAVGSGIFAFGQTLAGPQAAGRWAGLQNGFANFAGVIAPALTGIVTDRTGNFVVPFLITAAVVAGGGLAWLFIVGPLQAMSWKPEAANQLSDLPAVANAD